MSCELGTLTLIDQFQIFHITNVRSSRKISAVEIVCTERASNTVAPFSLSNNVFNLLFFLGFKS